MGHDAPGVERDWAPTCAGRRAGAGLSAQAPTRKPPGWPVRRGLEAQACRRPHRGAPKRAAEGRGLPQEGAPGRPGLCPPPSHTHRATWESGDARVELAAGKKIPTNSIVRGSEPALLTPAQQRPWMAGSSPRSAAGLGPQTYPDGGSPRGSRTPRPSCTSDDRRAGRASGGRAAGGKVSPSGGREIRIRTAGIGS